MDEPHLEHHSNADPQPHDIDPRTFLDERGYLRPKPASRSLYSADQVTPEIKKLWNQLAVADELQSKSRAENTHRAYGLHVTKFIEWCEESGVSALPATSESVMAHLASLAVATDEFGNAVRHDSDLVASTSVSNVQVRLAAINKLHEYAAQPKPGDNQGVQSVMSSVVRTFGRRAKQPKAATDLDALQAMLTALEQRELLARRDACIVWARKAGLSGGQMARLRWADIDIQDGKVAIAIPPHPQATTSRIVLLRDPRGRRGLDRARNATQSFLELASVSSTQEQSRVFVHPDGRALGRHAFVEIVNRNPCDIGDWDSTPGLPAKEVSVAAHEVWLRGAAIILRDRALLATGWFLAYRRSNIVALNRVDVAVGEKGATVVTRFSKTDQLGEGVQQFLPRIPAEEELPDPVALLEAWLDAYKRLAVVADIAADWPLFPSLGKQGSLKLSRTTGRPQRLSGAHVNTLVAEAARLGCLPGADKAGTYGAHSLRAGFVTEAFRDDKLSIAQIQEVTGHKSVSTLLQYRREANIEKASPAAALLRKRRASAREGNE